MKKLLLFLACIMSISFANAQFRSKQVYAYGVDFAYVKVLGAGETPAQFSKAFEGINRLLLNEPGKYDVSAMVNKRVFVDIDPMLERLSGCDYSDIKIYKKNEAVALDCEEIVKEYELAEEEGVGIVLIAKLLNKPSEEGTFYVVQFDIATREVQFCKEVRGEAGGYGLRNYWAASVCEVIEATRVRLDKE